MNDTQTKVCNACKSEKSISEFYRDKTRKDGLANKCKICFSEYRKQNRHIFNKSQKKYTKKNKAVLNEKQRDNYKKNCEYIKERQRNYRKINIAKVSESERRYKKANRETVNKNMRSYISKRVKDDFIFALKKRVRCLVVNSIKDSGYTKNSKVHEILGCSYEEFKTHIESQFLDGMSWENRNEWHIDHFIPLASAKTESEILKLNHYTNLRPMWAIDNIRKGAKMPHEHNYK